MKAFQPGYSTARHSAWRVAGILCVVAASGSAFAGDSQLGTQAPGEAKNLARMNCGARIECITPDGRIAAVPILNERNESAAALIMDDTTISAPLQEGNTTFIITLPSTSMLNRFTFVNENAAAEGEMRIAVSNYQLAAASPKWTGVDGAVNFTRKRIFNLSMVGVEAKYVRLSFRVDKGGRIAAFGLYGDRSLQAFAVRHGEQRRISNVSKAADRADALNYNVANLYAHSRVVYVSSGPLDAARQMIDDDALTTFKFNAADPNPTVVVELAESERIHRVSALYKMQRGRLDVYALDQLRKNPGDLSGLEPVASVFDTVAGGKAAVDFDPHGARYLALRWSSEEHGGNQPFEVAEVCAFSDVTLAALDIVESPLERFAATVNGPSAAIADPPVIAVVSR